MSWARRHSSNLAAAAVVVAALALLAWGFWRASKTRPALVASAAASAPIPTLARISAGRFHADPRDWDVPNAAVIDEDLDAFDLDALEVTEGAWASCVADGACPAVALRGDASLPITNVTASEARAFCVARGGDLPTSVQFGRAAGGANGARFPWGDVGPVCASAAWGLAEGPCAFDEASPVVGGSRPRGATAEGAHDLAGNVAEWVRLPDDGVEIRGGSFRDATPTALKTWHHRSRSRAASQDDRFDDVGFRCAFPVR